MGKERGDFVHIQPPASYLLLGLRHSMEHFIQGCSPRMLGRKQ
jgi:hypothetical protein